MDGYHITGTEANIGSTAQTVLSLIASTSTRARLDEVEFGHSGTPADVNVAWLGRRFTADGTGSAVTIQKDDMASPAAQLTAKQGYTAEPTYTAGTEFIDLTLNARSHWIWQPRNGHDIVIPATAASGVGLSVSHASDTGPAKATFRYAE